MAALACPLSRAVQQALHGFSSDSQHVEALVVAARHQRAGAVHVARAAGLKCFEGVHSACSAEGIYEAVHMFLQHFWRCTGQPGRDTNITHLYYVHTRCCASPLIQ